MPVMQPSREPEPCVVVIFGASGDLTARKLIPALYEMQTRGQLPNGLRVLGVSRTEMTDDEFREKLRAPAEKSARGFQANLWNEFVQRVHYHPADAAKPAEFAGLSTRIQSLGEQAGINRVNNEPSILFYLSVAPSLYEPIIASIGASGLVTEGKRWCSLRPQETAWQRIVIEKPFGRDVSSAESLNRALGRVFEEDAIFRIDHYLGKELVQNILVMRFANAIFEPMWNRNHIEHVQVTAAETIGVGSRAANFYDEAGALRDMIQSHLLQVLALVAMEPPSRYEADAIMREKIKLFNTGFLARDDQGGARAVLGRYGEGPEGPAYVDEKGVNADRRTETYGAIQIGFENWRWAGVPIFIRSGKRMAQKRTEVVVQFANPPLNLFGSAIDGAQHANRLIIAIAPHEGLSLELKGKVPGSKLKLGTAALDLDYVERFGGEPIEAYGPLLLDAMRGDRTLYKHRDEVETGWRIVQPVLDCPRVREAIETYKPGSWGPVAADRLIESGVPSSRSGARWHNPS